MTWRPRFLPLRRRVCPSRPRPPASEAKRFVMWRWMSRPEVRAPLLALACASALGVAWVAWRTVPGWRGQHLYLVWNLFLAWVPLVLALCVEELERRGRAGSWKFRGTVLAWLLFFPNAPYI